MSAPGTIRYLTVDAQPLVHGGVRYLLSPFPDLQPAGEAFELGDALRLAPRCAAGVALVEIGDLGPEWVAGLRRLSLVAPAMRLVVFSATADGAMVQEALRAGARGYLLKHAQPLMLAHGLRGVAAGQQVLAPEATQALVAQYESHVEGPQNFSQREREVLLWLAHGLSNDAIAERLCVSRSTVKFHCSNIFAKLGVRSRSQALVRAYEHGLVPRVVARSAAPVLPEERRGPLVVARPA